METTLNELNKHLTPIELRALNDFLRHLNVLFLGARIDEASKATEDTLIYYFSDVDFSKKSSEVISAMTTIKIIRNLKPEIKRIIFANIINATHHLMFWKKERELIVYLINMNFIGAKEIMMLNCSYILRNLLPYNGCGYKFTSDDFFNYEMRITEDVDFHCHIYINTGHGDRGDFVNIFIDYDTIKLIRPYLISPEGSAQFISNKLDEKNFFLENGDYNFAYKKDGISGDAFRNGVWFCFYDIQFQKIVSH